jgi:hypothetical protein
MDRPQPNFCEELKRFNEARREQFGRAPTPDDPLPIKDSNKAQDD